MTYKGFWRSGNASINNIYAHPRRVSESIYTKNVEVVFIWRAISTV